MSRTRKKTVISSIILQSVITVLFAIITWFAVRSFIDWIHTPPDVQDLALPYFRIKTIALPLQALSTVFLISIKALKKGKLALGLSFITIYINFSLDALFISNYSFSLRLGLVGSAWNTVASSGFSCIISGVVLFALLHKVPMPKLALKSTAWEIVRIGKWNGLESGVRNLGYIMGVVTVVNIIGAAEPSAIGGYNTAIWVMWAITLIPVLAWTEATNIAVGHAYGQRDPQAMKDVQTLSTLLMGIYMLVWVGIGALWWDNISMWLNAGVSSEVVAYSVRTFHFLMGAYILFTIGSGLKSFFLGTGQPQAVFVASTVVNVLIYIPLGVANVQPSAISYTMFLWVSIGVFCIDFLITIGLLRAWGYTKLQFPVEPLPITN